MHVEAFLLVVAQLAIVQAGFAGVVRQFSPARAYSARERTLQVAGLRLAFEHDAALLAFAVLPFPLGFLMGTGAWTWRFLSMLIAGFLAYAFTWNYLASVGRLPVLEVHEDTVSRALRISVSRPRAPRLHRYLFLWPTAIVGALMTVNLLVGSFGLYAVALCWLLVPPSIQYYYFIYWELQRSWGDDVVNVPPAVCGASAGSEDGTTASRSDP